MFKWYTNLYKHHARIIGGKIEIGNSFGVFEWDSIVGGYIAVFFQLRSYDGRLV